MSGIPWHDVPLVALDLEGSGAQDRDHEAILEIATVPITGGQPDLRTAYCTLVNPGRPIPARPWISPGLTNDTLRTAPTLTTVEPVLAQRLNGRYVVGHNIGVDWRLLHRQCPTIRPSGLLDTLRLARHLKTTTGGNGLVKLVEHHGLARQVDALAAGSGPHRALWDAVAAAVLLATLIDRSWPDPPTIDQLVAVAGPVRDESVAAVESSVATVDDQPLLFE